MFSFLLLQPPPDTSNYMILGYAVIFSMIAIYLISLVIRQRNFKRDEQMLEELEHKPAKK